MRPSLAVTGVTVSFGGVRALDDLSIEVADGAIAGVIGPNGAGKTTLFGAIGGYVPLDRGKVFVRGIDVTSWPPHRRATAGVGRTFQRLELFGNLTVAENLLVAREVSASPTRFGHDLLGLPIAGRNEQAARRFVDDVLDTIGLGWAAARPAHTLPLGAGRLLEIGRALCSEPTLLLLDEPSSGLDRRESAMLSGLIGEVAKSRGTTVLLVEHDVLFVSELCSEVFVLDFGRVIAHGTPDEVRSESAVQAAYLGAEVS